MRLFSFLFNLITLFPIKPEVGIKNHIIMSEEKKKYQIGAHLVKGQKKLHTPYCKMAIKKVIL